MQREVVRSRQPDVTLTLQPLPLSAAQLAALQRLPNVVAIEPRTLFATRVWVGGRRERAIVVGVDDFSHQRADLGLDRRRPDAGRRAPPERPGQRRQGLHGRNRPAAHAPTGEHALPVSGVGRNLTGGEDDPTNDWITFYATTATVAAAQRRPGLHVAGLASARRPPRRSRAHRRSGARPAARPRPASSPSTICPCTSSPATTRARRTSRAWRGLLNIVTLLAVLSALVLISSTMTTLIGEQTGEIAAMKAIGARRRDIRRMYLRTALLLGAIGAVAGAALGVLLANALAGFLASMLYRRRGLRRLDPDRPRQPRARHRRARRWRRCRRSGAPRGCRSPRR